jgi:beta-phosphoglucomutase
MNIDFKNKKGIIFDMDGVLVDSEPVITKAAIMGLKEYGIDPVEADFLPFTGTGEDSFIGGVAKKYGLQYRTEMKDRVYEIYLTIVDDEIKVFEGIKELLEKLKESGKKLALASSADRIKVKANLKAAKIPFEYFDVIVAAEDVTDKKPAPDIFILAKEKLMLSENECIVMEDAISGIKAANAAKIDSIGVMSSFDENELINAGCKGVLSNTKDLFTYFS